MEFQAFSMLMLMMTISCFTSSSSSFRIASYNLRYDSKPDNITVKQTLDSLTDPMMQPTFMDVSGEAPWSTRRIRIAQELMSEGVVLAGKYDNQIKILIFAHLVAQGFQEALIRQVHDLAELLGDDWGWVCSFI